MNQSQFVRQPHGVTVRGSAVIRIEPDSATISFSVREAGRNAAESMERVKAKTAALNGLSNRLGGVVKASRPVLVTGAGTGKLAKQVAIYAVQTVNIELSSLQHFEILQVALVDNGHKSFTTKLKSSGLRDARVDARQSAVLAAAKKADLFAEAAGIKVGRILHIEEVDHDPNIDTSSLEEFPGVISQNPSCIEVVSSVIVSFSIKGGGTPEVTGEFHFL